LEAFSVFNGLVTALALMRRHCVGGISDYHNTVPNVGGERILVS
jgi:hypothetical protein